MADKYALLHQFFKKQKCLLGEKRHDRDQFANTETACETPKTHKNEQIPNGNSELRVATNPDRPRFERWSNPGALAMNPC